MGFKRSPLGLAVSLLFSCASAVPVMADEGERVLAPVTTTLDRYADVHARTELGKLTESTPISGAVVDRDEIENLEYVNSLAELGRRVPGISMVRNLRIPDGSKNYTENRVDGMRVSSTSNFTLLDEVNISNVERIEVITGPGSALYGSGALGGTLSVFTRQPPKGLEGRLSQEFGSWDFQRTQGYVGASTEDGRLGFSLNGAMMDNGGWRKDTAPSAANAAAEHKNGASLRAMARPTDTTRITLGYDQLHYDFRLAGAVPLTAADAARLRNAAFNGASLRGVSFASDWQQVVPGTYGQSINDFDTYSARLVQMVGARGEFSLAFSQRNNDGLGYGSGGSGGALNVICDNKVVTCATVNGSGTSTNTLKKTREVTRSTTPMYRQEFDLAKSTLYVGAELIDISSDSVTYNNAYNAKQAQAGSWGQGTLSNAGSLAREKDVTPFIHYEFSPLEKLRFHIGERFDKITYSTDDRTPANKDVQKTFNAQILKSGVTYDLNANHLVWGNWSETFNAPNLSTLLDTAAKGTAGNTIGANLRPEEGVTREIGLRGFFPGRGLRYDMALYHTTNKGFIVSRNCTAAEQAALNNGAACNINENAGQFTARGFESMYSWAATSWLDLGATYTYAEAYYNKYKTAAADYSGNSYQAMPRNRLNLRVAVKPAAGWNVELEGDYISRYYYDTANTGTYARPTLFNLRASYRDKHWGFWVHVLNLTDRKYAARVTTTTIAGVQNVVSAATVGNSGTYTPLTVRAGLSYSF